MRQVPFYWTNMPKAYYNEIDPFASAWLKELIRAGHIADGDVDTRSIEDITPSDLHGYTQCHFFAGIGGWSYALRLAGWPDDRTVWTGSCPCQPFSAAGKGAGFADERHLWPTWLHLIRQCRPRVVFGEQVANNLAWLDLVQTDLEGEDYASGAVIIGAHSVGAPHIRQRLYWLADAGYGSERNRFDMANAADGTRGEARKQRVRADAGHGGHAGGRADTVGERREKQHPLQWQERGDIPKAAGRGALSCLVNPDDSRPQGWVKCRDGADERVAGTASVAGGLGNAELYGHDSPQSREMDRGADTPTAFGSGERLFEPEGSDTLNPWARAELIPCTDGKARPIEPSIFPLADGVSARVGILRGAGNAIVPQAAAAFVHAYLKL